MLYRRFFLLLVGSWESTDVHGSSSEDLLEGSEAGGDGQAGPGVTLGTPDEEFFPSNAFFIVIRKKLSEKNYIIH